MKYFGSLFQKIVFGSTSWDYSSRVMNISGRVNLQMALLWNTLGIAFTRFVFPTLVRLLSAMKNKFWRIGCIALSIFMAVNLLLSAAEVMWWRGQITGNSSPANAFEQLFDKTYDNEAMKKNYPDMKFSGQKA